MGPFMAYAVSREGTDASLDIEDHTVHPQRYLLRVKTSVTPKNSRWTLKNFWPWVV